jgi:hypothetical protein
MASIILAVPVVTHAEPASLGSSETVEEATCRIVENAARSTALPVALLTRLFWVESRFKAGATSSAGAQGVAQFMPQTAAGLGLDDPYDPEKAIPTAARLLVDLDHQFGNIGLAAAAYNAGPARVASWVVRSGDLPRQTEAYVLAVTGRPAEDWAGSNRDRAPGTAADDDQQSCLQIIAALRASDGVDQSPIAPWGVQLAGNFSKPIALASFQRMRQRFAALLGDLRPMIIGSRLRSPPPAPAPPPAAPPPRDAPILPRALARGIARRCGPAVSRNHRVGRRLRGAANLSAINRSGTDRSATARHWHASPGHEHGDRSCRHRRG